MLHDTNGRLLARCRPVPWASLEGDGVEEACGRGADTGCTCCRRQALPPPGWRLGRIVLCEALQQGDCQAMAVRSGCCLQGPYDRAELLGVSTEESVAGRGAQ